MSDDKDEKNKTLEDRLSRRSMLGIGSAALAAAGSCTQLFKLRGGFLCLKEFFSPCICW
jgi:hypothetical protein